MAFERYWYLKQFKNPILKGLNGCIDKQEDSSIAFNLEDNVVEVALADADSRDAVFDTFLSLLEVDGVEWSEVLPEKYGDEVEEILFLLYVNGCVVDKEMDFLDKNNNAAAELIKLLNDFTEALSKKINDASEDVQNRVSRGLAKVMQHLNVLVSTFNGSRFVKSTSALSVEAGWGEDIWEEKDFYLLSILVQIRYLQLNNPLAMLLIYDLCQGLTNPIQSNWREVTLKLKDAIEYYTNNIYSLRDVKASLRAFHDLVIGMLSENYLRVNTEVENLQESICGINFALLAEDHAKKISEDLGDSKFLSSLEDGKNHTVLAPACYIQEYFVNYRFVETITPMITKRLTDELKRSFWRYYQEEIGHEQYELETCKSLGISEDYIYSSLPLCLTQIFCDAFSYLAGCEEVGYLSSIMITEGVPGEPSLINKILSESEVLSGSFNEASRDHEELNKELNHQYLSRIFLSRLSRISMDEQRRALHILRYMVELNFRAWEALHERHIQNNNPYLDCA